VQPAGGSIGDLRGGDSALDCARAAARAASLVLVHRRHEFRAAPASVARMQEQVAAARMRCFEAQPHSLIIDDGALRGVKSAPPTGRCRAAGRSAAGVLRPASEARTIAEWGLALEKKALTVDTEKFQTSLPGSIRGGCIKHLPGKEEAHPVRVPRGGTGRVRDPASSVSAEKQFLQYTTTSPVMHRRLGVPD